MVSGWQFFLNWKKAIGRLEGRHWFDASNCGWKPQTMSFLFILFCLLVIAFDVSWLRSSGHTSPSIYFRSNLTPTTLISCGSKSVRKKVACRTRNRIEESNYRKWMTDDGCSMVRVYTFRMLPTELGIALRCWCWGSEESRWKLQFIYM